jgi:hypothetical protein
MVADELRLDRLVSAPMEIDRNGRCCLLVWSWMGNLVLLVGVFQ